MRSGPIALRAAGAAVVLVLAPAAGTALAHDGVQVTVTPSAAAPGGAIDVRVTGCEGATGAARSPAFVADAELSGAGGGKNPLSGGARVRSGVEEGAYEVSVTCDGDDHAGAGTIKVGSHEQSTGRPTGRPAGESAGQSKGQSTGRPTNRPAHQPAGQQPSQQQAGERQSMEHQPTRHASVAPVRAGGGGAAAFAAPAAPGMAQTASEEGLGTPYTLLGFGMAALAAVAVAFRSARRRGGSGSGSGSGPGSD
ncbi:hypothetical protein ACIRSU_34625 [Streptomyces sp. NPDC101160]|uniref:hypothetical protein n=1 Tax=Streptomyces sp. NPDC101160 TaxID=3366118 RepID=UPI0037F1C4F2